MSRSQTLPDLEDLAAYIDGRLGDARRVEVEARLADDEDYYELFLETVRLQRELEEEEPSILEDGPAKVVPIRRRRGVLTGLGVAAGLALATGWSLWEPNDPLAGLDAGAILTDSRLDQRNLKTFRSGLIREGKAYVLGVWAVNLELAAAVGSPGADLRFEATSNLGAESEGLDLFRARREFQRLAADLEADHIVGVESRIKNSVRQLEHDLAERELANEYARGRWVETGRLAVLAGDPELATKALREIESRVEPTDWPKNAESPQELLDQLSGASDIDQATASQILEVLRRLHYDLS